MADEPPIPPKPQERPAVNLNALFDLGFHSVTDEHAPASDYPQELQRHLPQYRVRELIGRGGMGHVMKVDDPKLFRTVALKTMKLGPEATEQERGRFIREAEVLARLAHPNIVPIYELGADEIGHPFYTMKLVKGRTLQAILNDIRDGAPDAAKQHDLGRLLSVFRKVCDAVAFAHSRGVLHRDLKPDNVMVGEFGEVLVMDWGLSKFLHGEEEAWSAAAVTSSMVARSRESIGTSTLAVTLDGLLMGTPQYMSPEQAEGKIAEMDERSDVFSLGAILYAILTLHPPVEGKTVDEVLKKISSGQFAAPSIFGVTTELRGRPATRGEVLDARVFRPLPHCPGGRAPAALSIVTMKALRLDKELRYQAVNELSAEVEAWQSGFATRAENARFMKQLSLLVKRHKGVFTTAAAAWLIITALVVWFVIHLRASESETRRQAEIATSNADLAGKNAREAKQNEQKAVAETARATRAERAAITEKETTRRALAKSQIALAEAAFREQDGMAMQAALDEVPNDLRDSNWNYLLGKSDTSLNTLRTRYTPDQAVPHPTQPGVFAIVTGRDHRVAVVEVRTGVTLLKFQPSQSENSSASRIYRIAFSPDGESLAIGRHGRGGIAIHSARDGKRLSGWETADTDSLQFSPDGKQLLEVGEDKQLNLWNAATGKRIWTRPGGNRLKALFDASGEAILTYSDKEKLMLLNARDGSVLRNLPGPPQASVASMAIHPNGRQALTGDARGFVRCVDLSNGTVRFQIRANDKPVHSIAFTADGTRFVTLANLSGGRQSVQVWDARTGALLQPLLGGSGGSPNLCVHPLSGELVVCGGLTKIWDLVNQAEKWMIPVTTTDYATIAFWGEDELFARKGVENAMQLLSLSSNDFATLWKADRKGDRMVSVSANGRIAAISTAASNLSSFQLLHKSGSTVESATALQWKGFAHLLRLSPKGDRLFVGGRDSSNPSCIIESATGTELARLNKEGLEQIHDVGWSGNTRLVAAVTAKAHRGLPDSEDQLILFDASTGGRLKTASLQTRVSCLAVSPGGKIFAEAGMDRMVRLRDTATLKLKEEFRAHDGPISVLAWHPSLPILATASEDLTIKLWNTETGRLLAELHGAFAAPMSLTFSPSGKRLACLSLDNTVRVWEPQALNPNASTLTSTGGWEDLLAKLKPADVAKTGNGWELNNGVLLSQKRAFAMVPLAGKFSQTSYQLRLKVRQLEPEDSFSVILPVADRQTSFMLDGHLNDDRVSSLDQIDGTAGKDDPAAVKGKVVKDNEKHDLEITVRLEGANARIEVRFDDQPLYRWSGAVKTLGLSNQWTGVPSGNFALGAHKGDWVVYDMKLKRLQGK